MQKYAFLKKNGLLKLRADGDKLSKPTSKTPNTWNFY